MKSSKTYYFISSVHCIEGNYDLLRIVTRTEVKIALEVVEVTKELVNIDASVSLSNCNISNIVTKLCNNVLVKYTDSFVK